MTYFAYYTALLCMALTVVLTYTRVSTWWLLPIIVVHAISVAYYMVNPVAPYRVWRARMGHYAIVTAIAVVLVVAHHMFLA